MEFLKEGWDLLGLVGMRGDWSTLSTLVFYQYNAMYALEREIITADQQTSWEGRDGVGALGLGLGFRVAWVCIVCIWIDTIMQLF